MWFKKVLILLLFILLCFVNISDEEDKAEISMQSSVDKRKITIGDPINYKITLTYPEGFKLALPEDKKGLGDWVIKDIKTQDEKSPFGKTINYTLTAFTTGEILIPEINFRLVNKNGVEKKVKTQSLKITIESLLEKYGDIGNIRDIKAPLNIRYSLFSWILIFLALASGFIFWYIKYQKRKIHQLPVSKVPPEPPGKIALIELDKLKNSDLIKEGRIKEFYIALVDIVRDYLSAVYSIETRDRTTSEIYAELKRNETDKKILAFIKDFFDQSDLVKFAKYRPEEKICWQDWESAKNIIDMTKFKIQEKQYYKL